MKAKLQILTLVLLVIAITLFAFTRISIEPHDKLAKDIIGINSILSSLWLAFTIVFVVVKGVGEKPVERIVRVIRELFVRPTFISLSLIIFLFINVTLSYQLLMYRQLEFISDKKVILYESRGVGESKKIGIVPKDEPIKYRLKIGEKYLYYEVVNNGSIGSLEPFTIHFYSKGDNKKRIKISSSYEKL